MLNVISDFTAATQSCPSLRALHCYHPLPLKIKKKTGIMSPLSCLTPHKSHLEIILRIILTWGPLHHHVTLLQSDCNNQAALATWTLRDSYNRLPCYMMKTMNLMISRTHTTLNMCYTALPLFYMEQFETIELIHSIVNVVSDNEHKRSDVTSGRSAPETWHQIQKSWIWEQLT